VPSTLADSGPLVALFDRSDKYHLTVLEFARAYRGRMVTTWLVATEVCHLLGFSATAQLDFLHWIQRGGLELANLGMGSLDTIIKLTEKYRDRPMDLADASMVVLSMQTGIRNIISLDSDFDIYRLPDKGHLRNLLRKPA
jgi:hypothetical protein